MEIITLENYSFKYPNSDTNAVDGISLKIKEGGFYLLCGRSGCGKTTLLRALKPAVSPHGVSSGTIYFKGESILQSKASTDAGAVGFVMQDPDNQIVTDSVWHELAFGLENMGISQKEMQRRVAETAHFFGISPWFERQIDELSGGQKQTVSLAAVVAMHPEMIILDEPTVGLDPIAATEFLGLLSRINRELGVTVLLSEHRMEDVLELCDGVFYLESGKVKFSGDRDDFLNEISGCDADFYLSLPAATRIYLDYTKKRDIEKCCSRYGKTG